VGPLDSDTLHAPRTAGCGITCMMLAALLPAPLLAQTPEVLTVEVVSVRPHDPAAWTQGLLFHDGALYESTGLHGSSSLRKVDPLTGAVLQQHDLAVTDYAEGLARVGDQLYQLTWQQGLAYVYDLASFTELDQHSYSGEGWGLCYDGTRLILSDGSDRLSFIDPADFSVTGSVAVTIEGEPLAQLNELECVDGRVLANIWWTRTIVEIDPGSGVVTRVINVGELLTPEEQQAAEVLNGIAYDPVAGTYLITGKLWPKLFEVRFVSTQPVPDAGSADHFATPEAGGLEVGPVDCCGGVSDSGEADAGHDSEEPTAGGCDCDGGSSAGLAPALFGLMLLAARSRARRRSS